MSKQIKATEKKMKLGDLDERIDPSLIRLGVKRDEELTAKERLKKRREELGAKRFGKFAIKTRNERYERVLGEREVKIAEEVKKEMKESQVTDMLWNAKMDKFESVMLASTGSKLISDEMYLSCYKRRKAAEKAGTAVDELKDDLCTLIRLYARQQKELLVDEDFESL